MERRGTEEVEQREKGGEKEGGKREEREKERGRDRLLMSERHVK